MGHPVLLRWKTMRFFTSGLLRLILCLVVAAALLSADSSAAPVSGYKIVARHPHSTDSYTEGFFYLDGLFYEGTGINGRSAVMVIDPKTGRSVQRRDLPAEY